MIFIEDRGPLFYRQTRTGLNGKPINIIKFRSMKIDAEKMESNGLNKEIQGLQILAKFDN